jgi:N-acetyl-gamma-glutamyl-phosphate reductase
MPDPTGKLRVAVLGASGYTGSEMVRLLLGHPSVEISLLTAGRNAGKRFSELHPQFLGLVDMELAGTDALAEAELDYIFLALPHSVSMGFVAGHDIDKVPLIDLSGDFRLGSAATYEQWYGEAHACPALLERAVYGLPELNRDQIRTARLIANPGCYPTSAILPLAPLLRAGLIQPGGIIIDSKSGVSGAGNKPRSNTHFPEVYGNFSAYGIGTHRHTPEIEETLSTQAEQGVSLQFTPHLLPVSRGILSTIYARPLAGVSEAQLQDALQAAYADEPFVRLRSALPSLAGVRGSNFCDIHLTLDARSGNIIIVSVIDNLVKGAAGQAIQNMNIMAGLPEGSGLQQTALSP